MLNEVTTHGPISQATFLTKLGMEIRVDELMRSASNSERQNAIGQAARRLVDPLAMGKQYQFLSVTKNKGDKTN